VSSIHSIFILSRLDYFHFPERSFFQPFRTCNAKMTGKTIKDALFQAAATASIRYHSHLEKTMSHAESKKLKKNAKPDREHREEKKDGKSALVVKNAQKVAVGITVPTPA
ncbi:MAG: hypothetical protein H7839_20565, partial [Magnetococcus sp. YQC-5]